MITGFNTNPRASGHVFTMGLWGELWEGQTLQCSHCQHTWILKKGSGRERGFCTKCMGYTCGKPECDECVPIEQRCSNIEAGLHPLTPKPAMVLVPSEIELVSPGLVLPTTLVAAGSGPRSSESPSDDTTG